VKELRGGNGSDLLCKKLAKSPILLLQGLTAGYVKGAGPHNVLVMG